MSKFYSRDYPLLELYVYLKVQVKALEVFEDEEIVKIIVGDLCDNRTPAGAFIYYVIGAKWFSLLVPIYKKYGLKWFRSNFANSL